MSNKLKKMLDQKENGFVLTLNYKTQEERNRFINVVNQICESEQSQKVPVPQSMEIIKTQGDNQYPIEIQESIVEMMGYPSQDLVVFPITIDGKSDSYYFLRKKENDTFLLKTVDSKVFDIELKFTEKSMNFTYTSHPGNVESIDELITEYKRFLALIEFLFYNDVSNEKLEDMKKYIKNSILLYTRAKEICRVLNMNVPPKRVIEEDDKDYLIEKIYLLLVKKSIIRQNDKLNHIGLVDVENVQIGQELFAIYRQTLDLEMFGEHREIYTVNCIFGAKIQRLEHKQDGNNIVYFKDSEKNPMYRAYTAFLDRQAANEEFDSIMEKRRLYESAGCWIDQWRELIQE